MTGNKPYFAVAVISFVGAAMLNNGLQTHNSQMEIMGVIELMMGLILFLMISGFGIKICRPNDFPEELAKLEKRFREMYGEPESVSFNSLGNILKQFGAVHVADLYSNTVGGGA